MDNQEIETQPLEGVGVDVFTQAEFPTISEKLYPEARAAEILAEADKYTYPPVETLSDLPAASSTKAGLVDALSLTIDALQEVFAELTDAKAETLAVAKRATEKATRAGVELDLSLLDDPFDSALGDVNRLLNTLERQRNRARMAAEA